MAGERNLVLVAPNPLWMRKARELTTDIVLDNLSRTDTWVASAWVYCVWDDDMMAEVDEDGYFDEENNGE